MLLKRLKGLIPSSNVVQPAYEHFDTWDTWLQPLSGADSTTTVGRDPSYEDAFCTLKDEVAKLTGIDDASIVASCEQLIKEVGKDLRVAAYYTFARLRQQGLAGFAEGLALTAALLERFGESLLPARPEARKGALEWLAAARMIETLAMLEAFAPADRERACAALLRIVTVTTDWHCAARPNLQVLLAFLERSETPPRRPESASATQTVNAEPKPVTRTVSSMRDLLDQVRTMANYLRDQENGYLPSVRLVRAVRWDTLHDAPPADLQSHTRLMPPRPELRQQMQRFALNRQWPDLLERVEGAFMEGANHLWFDLQYCQHLAFDHLGAPYSAWAAPLRTDFALFLERLPGIERLVFNDGTPFADDSTLAWIARQVVTRNRQAGAGSTSPPFSADHENGAAGNWPEIERQARELATRQSLDAAFSWLAALPGVRTDRQRYMLRLVMARLADHAGRVEAAIALLGELEVAAQTLKLSQWEPALVFEVKQQLLESLRAMSHDMNADKPMLRRRVEQLRGELMVLDPVRTLTLS